jgi:hypothetical protein
MAFKRFSCPSSGGMGPESLLPYNDLDNTTGKYEQRKHGIKSHIMKTLFTTSGMSFKKPT